jgi:hypothetical protein
MIWLDLLQQFTNVAAVLPDPQPEQPPGTDGITTVINWVAWIALIAGVVGFLGSAAYLGIASFTGREINGVKGLVISIFVCILVGAAGAILAIFV